jgi:deoxyadenosine/deoxycytidine kinase
MSYERWILAIVGLVLFVKWWKWVHRRPSFPFGHPSFALELGKWKRHRIEFRGQHVIIVDGLIGGGKSTLVRHLARYFQSLTNPTTNQPWIVAEVQEPVHEWRSIGILSEFYQDMTRWTYTFQTFTYLSRIRAILTSLEQTPNAEILICERSVLTDRYMFMENLRNVVTPVEWNMYNDWFNCWSYVYPFDLNTAKYIYVKTDVDHAMNRIARRGRQEELVTGQIPPETPLVSPRSSAAVDHKESEVTKKKDGVAGGGILLYQRVLSILQRLGFIAQTGVSREYQLQLMKTHDEFFASGILRMYRYITYLF